MYKFRSIEEERAIRIRAFQCSDLKEFPTLIEDLSSKLPQIEVSELARFYEELLRFDYQHPGLSKTAYMSHPIRVARMYVALVKNVSIDMVKLALSHNILEVATIELKDIHSTMLFPLIPSIELLTVDRAIQWDSDYKQSYYGRIEKSCNLSIIKVLDKLDNLFLLEDNDDTHIRSLYLNEIQNYVIPLSTIYIPDVVGIFSELVNRNRIKLSNLEWSKA